MIEKSTVLGGWREIPSDTILTLCFKHIAYFNIFLCTGIAVEIYAVVVMRCTLASCADDGLSVQLGSVRCPFLGFAARLNTGIRIIALESLGPCVPKILGFKSESKGSNRGIP